jgi:hypothetical protein
VPDFVSISYRGAKYALGQGPQFYGIWHAAAPQSQPLEWWPLTPEGWSSAWTKFVAVEVPGSIVAVPPPAPQFGPSAGQGPAAQPASPPYAAQQPSWRPQPEPGPAALARNARIAAALLGIGLVLGVIGLFPLYTDGASLGSVSADLVPHVFYLAAWALSGVLILLGAARLRVGALLGLGTSAVALGFFVADVGTAAAGGAHLAGAGLVLSVLGWLACTAGVAVAGATGTSVRSGLGWMRGLRSGAGPERARSQHSHEIVPVVTLLLAALGAAIAFAPSWDSFTLRALSGASQTVTEGNAFANPGLVIFGDVLVMVALVAVVALAALWRPTRLGAALAAGALIPMVGQAISAIVEISGKFTPQQFGVSSGQASQLGLSIHAGLTPVFWVYCAFLGTAILLCAWMLVTPSASTPTPAVPGPAEPGGVGSDASADPVSVQPGASAIGGPAAADSAESTSSP